MMLSEVYHPEEVKMFTNGFDKVAAYEIERRKDEIHSAAQSRLTREYLGKRWQTTTRMKKLLASTFTALLLLSVLISMAKG
jgi:hypothetical protein